MAMMIDARGKKEEQGVVEMVGGQSRRLSGKYTRSPLTSQYLSGRRAPSSVLCICTKGIPSIRICTILILPLCRLH